MTALLQPIEPASFETAYRTASDPVAALLQALVLEGWHFWLEGDRLRYRAPRAVFDDAIVAQLKAQKAAIVHQLATAPHMLEVCPLSYGQRALWFLWRLAPASQAYNQSLPLRIEPGESTAQAAAARWQAACQALVARHPMLRTCFPLRNGQPFQQVLPAAAPAWQVSDARDWDAVRLDAALAAAHAMPFDLEQAPPLRFHWFAHTAGDGGHVLLVTLHHILCDGWSLELMRRELNELADEGAAPAGLPPLTYCYRDYVRWQAALLAGEEGARLWDYWQAALPAPLPLLDLPVDFPRPAVQRYDGASCPLDLPPALPSSLAALAQAETTTPFVLFLATYAALLYRLTGQRDLLIGVPNSGRSRAEFAPVVGYFVNPLAVRIGLPEGSSFRELLQHVRRQMQGAVEHAEYPFPLLVQRLQPQRTPDRSPLFDVTMNYLVRRSATAGGAPGREAAKAFDIPQADGKFDLTLNIVDDDGRLMGALGYNRALFATSTVAAWAGCFTALLQGIAAEPDSPLELLPLETGGARAPAPALRGPRLPVTPAQMLHRAFAAQAARHPQAPAVADEQTTLTYAELDRRAGEVAARLAALGAGPDARVAVCTGRAVDFCVAMLGVLKAGAAYVPLEPGYPPDLLGQMVAQAGAVALVTQQHLRAHFATVRCPVLCVDLLDGSAQLPATLDLATLDNLAYVMFTSGSTGRPKAVAVEHGAVANYTASMIRALAVDGQYQFLLASTFAADLGNTVIFPALCTGGCLHILPEAARLDPQRFAAFVAERRIDYLKIVPSHLAALLGERLEETAEHKLALPRRALVLGGEGIAPAWVARLQAAAPALRIFNHYGPTETTVGVSIHAWQADEAPTTTATLPLSQAVANIDLYLLDAGQRAVPAGVAGEVYVGGAGLARGYLDDATHTAAAFVQVATGAAGEVCRLYRTGDLARRRADGRLELLGRRDRQVKLRGYRIELAQVEAVVRQVEGIDRAVVIPDADGAQATRLLAFLVVDAALPDQGALLARVQRQLAAQLPPYMQPAVLQVIPEVPLTANGKLDLHALRRQTPAPSAAEASILPRDAIELALCRLWAETLGVAQVGIGDDFFALGGHSLAAVQLVTQIQEHFGLWVPLATLLTHPTVEGLAPVLRAELSGRPRSAAAGSLLVPLHRGGNGPPLFLLPGAGGSVIYLARLARYLGEGGWGPVWGLQASGLQPGAPILGTVEAVAAQHVAAIRPALPATGPVCLVGHSFGGLVAYEMARRLAPDVPVRVGVLDNAAPQPAAMPAYAGYDHGDWLVHIARRMGKLNGLELPLLRADLDGMTIEEQNASLVARMIAHRLLPAETSVAYFSQFVDLYCANARAAATYRPGGVAALDLALFRATETDVELEERPATQDGAHDDPTWGWQQTSGRPVAVVEVPGTHLSIFAEPQVAQLAAAVGRWLAAAPPHPGEET